MRHYDGYGRVRVPIVADEPRLEGSGRKSEARRMWYSVQQCLDHARECDWMASQAKDQNAKAAFVELARQWQELARQKDELERYRPNLP